VAFAGFLAVYDPPLPWYTNTINASISGNCDEQYVGFWAPDDTELASTTCDSEFYVLTIGDISQYDPTYIGANMFVANYQTSPFYELLAGEAFDILDAPATLWASLNTTNWTSSTNDLIGALLPVMIGAFGLLLAIFLAIKLLRKIQ